MNFKSGRILPLIVICLLIALRLATISVKARTLVMTIVMLPDNQYYSEGVNGGTQAMNLSQVSYAQSLPADVIIPVGDNYNWTGGCTGTSLFCSVTLTSNQTLNAEFDPGSLGSGTSGQSITTGSAVIQ